VENTERSYKKRGKLVALARPAGLVDWSMIRDRVGRQYGGETRIGLSRLKSCALAALQFKIDRWSDRPNTAKNGRDNRR